MTKFKYKLSLGVKICMFLIITIWIAAATFSILKLCGKTIFVSINNVIDILTIIFAVLCIFALILLYSLHYRVDKNGIKLMLWFINLSGDKYSYKNVSALVYKVKTQNLLICDDLTAKNPKGTIVNIPQQSIKAFVDAVTQAGAAFDYVEDMD